MKRIILSFTLLLSSFILLNAQDYENSAGLRAGTSPGLTFKHFFSTSDAVEGILAFRYGGFIATGLYERHQTAFDTEGLYFYYGAGAHLGFYNTHPWDKEYNNSLTIIGIDGILGLEYMFEEIPFNISLDWKPVINLAGYTNIRMDEIALSFRYIF